MRLGSIQLSILRYLLRCGIAGGNISAITQAPELRGYALEAVERSLSRLVGRGIVQHKGMRRFYVPLTLALYAEVYTKPTIAKLGEAIAQDIITSKRLMRKVRP